MCTTGEYFGGVIVIMFILGFFYVIKRILDM